MPLTTIYEGDCLQALRVMSDNSIDCCVTSPPYYALRDYGVAGQMGLEATPRAYIENMTALFMEVYRVLKPEGTLWLNIGDSYASTHKHNDNGNSKSTLNHGRGGGNYEAQVNADARKLDMQGIKPKNLLMIPARLAISLQDCGWYLRSEIIWHKTAVMPESVTDRPTKSHEMIYLLTKSPRYYYNAKAVREPLAQSTIEDSRNGKGRIEQDSKYANESDEFVSNLYKTKFFGDPAEGRNMRDVWSLAPAQFKGSHFATFPLEIPRRCILAGCPENGTVLDPFGGSGTTALVANRLFRNAILCELNPDYVQMARKRIRDDAPLFNQVVENQENKHLF